MKEMTHIERVAMAIRDSNCWDEVKEDLDVLCEAAGLAQEWESADGENFEKVIEKAAERLQVQIY